MRNHVNDDETAGRFAEIVAQRGMDTRICLRPKLLFLETLAGERAPVDRPSWKLPETLRAAERVVDYICRAYESGRVLGKHFVPITSKQLKALCGRNNSEGRAWRYPEVLAMLQFLGVIETNQRYSSGLAGKNGFPKSFRLGEVFRHGLHFGMTTQLVKSCSLARKDRSNPSNEIQEALAANLARLRVDWDAIHEAINRPDTSIGERVRIVEDANKIERGLVDLTQGRKQARVYHVLNRAAKKARAAIRLEGENLVELDVRSCQPVLLLLLCPQEERANYMKLLRDDVYQLGGRDREKAKKQFARFAFGKYRRRNAFGVAFAARFPKLSERIRHFDGSLSAYLQDIEAKICIYRAGGRLMEEGIFWVSIHDGFMVRERDAPRVSEIIREAFAERIPDFEVDVRGGA